MSDTYTVLHTFTYKHYIKIHLKKCYYTNSSQQEKKHEVDLFEVKNEGT